MSKITKAVLGMSDREALYLAANKALAELTADDELDYEEVGVGINSEINRYCTGEDSADSEGYADRILRGVWH